MEKNYKAVVIGASAGGFSALRAIVSSLPKDFIPIIVVMHLKPDSESLIAQLLDKVTKMDVREANSGDIIKNGTIYISPPAYHLQIEHDKTLSLSDDLPVNFSCPAIDVLFESAAIAYHSNLIGIILTGANSDGSKGLKHIHSKGGLVIVQDPRTAEAEQMPLSAISAVQADHIASLDSIASYLISIHEKQKHFN